MTEINYAEMQKSYYNQNVDPKDLVGNYGWHEQFPYEQHLLYREGDLTQPLLTDTISKMAIDFGCGPGRMIRRMTKLFAYVDGVDISESLLKIASRDFPSSRFYISDGLSCGEAPVMEYDFVYSTLCLQHNPCHSIRLKILKNMFDLLKVKGCVSIQMVYHPTWYNPQHARWNENRYDAPNTNSGCDVVINTDDIPRVKDDFTSVGFHTVSVHTVEVESKYSDWNGNHHSPYWASHWLFIQGVK